MAQKIAYLILVISVSIEGQMLGPEPKNHQVSKKGDPPTPIRTDKGAVMNIDLIKSATDKANVAAKSDSSIPGNIKNEATQNDTLSEIHRYRSPTIESGAVMRGVFVFVGIALIFLIYVGFKNYRNRKPNVVITKYGVRTKRSDVEMRPLPLDDDEDDETVFDLGSVNRK